MRNLFKLLRAQFSFLGSSELERSMLCSQVMCGSLLHVGSLFVCVCVCVCVCTYFTAGFRVCCHLFFFLLCEKCGEVL